MRFFATALALCLCLPAAADPTGTFRQAHELGFGALSNLDPMSNGRVLQVTEKTMNRLVRPGADGTPQPVLATDWQPNEDGTEWTFTLREGVRFHDGTDFDAADVVYSLNRIIAPDNDSSARATIQMIHRIEAVGPYEVRMYLDGPFADLPLQLMDFRMRIIPDGSGDTIAQTGIGTGPFIVDRFDPDGITILRANSDYFEGPPGVAAIEVIAIPDAQARLQALLGGQIDMERGITPQLGKVLEASDRYAVQQVPTGNWIGMAFRTDVPPYDDARIRRALRLAVDRDEMLKLVLGGRGIVACDTPVAPNDQYRADIACPQDIAQARALLTDAGYPDGIDVTVHVSALDSSWPTMAVVYQQQAAAAGIRVKIKKESTDGYWSQVWMQKDAVTTRWNERPADQALNEAFSSGAKWNETYYKDAVFDQLMTDARSELDFDQRRALYEAAQIRLWENAGTLIPYHVTQLVGLSARVANLDNVKNDAVRWHLIRVIPDS
ncbi:ABC transporter substrate-binding protein [Pseudohalocynthiibacter aestuariivivens]|nr:ABC transporter substrate-binding protein [Pseudohalocynthiibacter aestuariivivens]QIE44345.1 ABC transporter substrate-binding protein [Pseudohalocynthiibacter aestuariivivens]